MEVEVVARDTIKPSSPTPSHLRSFKLSLFDQMTPRFYTSLTLFYSAAAAAGGGPGGEGDGSLQAKAASVSLRLKASLSEALTRLYPLAGIMNANSTSIDCNDDGVPYIEARVHCRLADVLKKPDINIIGWEFLPISFESMKSGMNWPILSVQVTFFECGGFAIGVSASHTIIDGTGLGIIIGAWATISNGGSGKNKMVVPDFTGATRFPPSDSLNNLPTMTFIPEKRVVRRFVFDASRIAALKANITNRNITDDARQPTRVRAVSALIWKCAMAAAAAASRSNASSAGSEKRPSVVTQTANLRKLLNPPLPDNCIGNFVTYFGVREDTSGGGGDIELHELVGKLDKGLIELRKKYANKLKLGGDDDHEGSSSAAGLGLFTDIGEQFNRDDIDLYHFNSWCGMPFNDADFGWGKPTFFCAPSSVFKNVVGLMDTNDGEGIEAWVALKEEQMAIFERDQQLLAFASLNPCVLNA